MLFFIFLFLGPHAFETTLGEHQLVCQKYQQNPKVDKNQSGNKKKPKTEQSVVSKCHSVMWCPFKLVAPRLS